MKLGFSGQLTSQLITLLMQQHTLRITYRLSIRMGEGWPDGFCIKLLSITYLNWALPANISFCFYNHGPFSDLQVHRNPKLQWTSCIFRFGFVCRLSIYLVLLLPLDK